MVPFEQYMKFQVLRSTILLEIVHSLQSELCTQLFFPVARN